jgi:hypothetical protein
MTCDLITILSGVQPPVRLSIVKAHPYRNVCAGGIDGVVPYPAFCTEFRGITPNSGLTGTVVLDFTFKYQVQYEQYLCTLEVK